MAQALNRLGYLGIGLAITGGLANSVLYNGELCVCGKVWGCGIAFG